MPNGVSADCGSAYETDISLLRAVQQYSDFSLRVLAECVYYPEGVAHNSTLNKPTDMLTHTEHRAPGTSCQALRKPTARGVLPDQQT